MEKKTYEKYKSIFETALKLDYQVIALRDFYQGNYSKNKKILINRIDIDVRIDRVKVFLSIFKELGVKASFFVRLHAHHYNALSIGNILILRDVVNSGHELGLHTELEDIGNFCNIDKLELLKREIELLETITNSKIYGTASHNSITPFNNLNFWKNFSPRDFGLLYEAYDDKIFKASRYISDSGCIAWKAYEKGKLLENDKRNPIEHMIEDRPNIIYLLTHPECWYERYIHE